MPGYHAIYRAIIESGSHRCPDSFFDWDYANGIALCDSEGNRFVSLAKNLGELTQDQFGLLIKLVSKKKHVIRPSVDWSVEQKKHGIVFLMIDSDYDRYGVEKSGEGKLCLKQMAARYERAKENEDNRFDPSILTPLVDCINLARAIVGVSDGSPANVRDDGTIAAIRELTAVIKEPKPVFLVDDPDEVAREDAAHKTHICPIEGTDGFWVTQDNYVARQNMPSLEALRKYRQVKNCKYISPDGTWGIDQQGHTFKKVAPGLPNSSYLYFVRHDIR